MRKYSPRLELVTLLALLALFGAGIGFSYTFADRGQVYPLAISIIGVCLVSIEFIIFALQVLRVNRYVPTASTELIEFWQSVKGIMPYVLALLVYFLLIFLIGLIVASGIWVAGFLFIFGRTKWYHAIAGGLGIMLATFLIVDLLVLKLPTALWDVFHIYRNDLRLPF